MTEEETVHSTDDRGLEERIGAFIDSFKSGGKGVLFSWTHDDEIRHMSVVFEVARFDLYYLHLNREIHTPRLNETSSEDIWVRTEKPDDKNSGFRDALCLDGVDALGRFLTAVCKVSEVGVDPLLISNRIIINRARMGSVPTKNRSFKSWSSKFEKLMYEDFNLLLELTPNKGLRSQ